MTQHSPTKLHSAQEAPKRPRGILKNSFSGSLPTGPSPPPSATIPAQPHPSDVGAVDAKELTLQNTLQNAGHRRSSSAATRNSLSRRHSGVHNSEEDNNPRLKWDEANLYLAEQEKSATMKITEPKTPYAKHYDPDEEEEEQEVDVEGRALDPQDLMVDELDLKKEGITHKSPVRGAREDEIPGLELGEPEEAVPEGEDTERTHSGGSRKHVSVGSSEYDDETLGMSKEERDKHIAFQEARKKHYEMKDVRGLLGHPLDAMDEDDDDLDEDVSPTQPMPPRNLVNGGR